MTVERDLLRLLAQMPFLDRLEAAALSGWSRGAVYAACAALGEAGLVAPLPHASELVAPARRYHLTVAGLHRLAADDGLVMAELLRSRPLTAHWRRLLLARLDGVASIYRLAAAIADAAWPLRFRWYRAMPMDAAIALPGGRSLFVVREGRSADRTAFAKRLWRLREGPRPGAYLLLAPDAVRLRHAARLMAQASVPAFLALERDAAASGTSARIWRTASGSPLLSLREVLAHVPGRGAWPREEPLARATVPRDLRARDLREPPDWMLPAALGAGAKRVLDLIADWPWIGRRDLAGLAGVSSQRVSQLLAPAAEAGLVTREAGRLALSDRGLALLARRDRSAVHLSLARWSAAPLDLEAPLSWRNVAGRRSRQLLRNLDHTAAVHGFAAALATQARCEGWEVAQLDPPHRASRFFRYDDRLHSVHPDAFGVLRREGKPWPFFLEWERRAVRPSTMAARLAPYLRYYASPRPTDDHGVRPAVLVVFEDELAAHHFLGVARGEIARARVDLPLFVSHRAALEREGPLGGAWNAPHAPGAAWPLAAAAVEARA
ncbi:MAG: replication-relaxation family protein [Chloroflexi bacterium]|nr:replication-relaxation family protein [Chloroflexota bacterium]